MDRKARGIDEIIQNAIKDGAFDNLPGKGKPLELEQNPFGDSEWELAYHLLKENGFAPEFIEKRKAIETELAAAREMLARAWQWRNKALQAGDAANWVESEWQRAKAKFDQIVEKLNKAIRSYNLSVPSAALHRKIVDSL
ncbi:MAG TPA: DnaJ family domain-containing protein, partial [Terriglobales bacterium]|nr:DnaJ family domain-containing protein [Terriglobales bacterium]